MSNAKPVFINLICPVLTGRDSFTVTQSPVESDIFRQVDAAFRSLNYQVDENTFFKFKKNNSGDADANLFASFDRRKAADVIRAELRCRAVVAFACINFPPSLSSPQIARIDRGDEDSDVNYGQNESAVLDVFSEFNAHDNFLSVCFVPDLYPQRGVEFLQVLEAVTKNCKVVLYNYKPLTSVLKILSKPVDLKSEALHFIPFLPTVGNFTAKKYFDFSYVGSARPARLAAIAAILGRSRKLKFFVSTIGREPVESNPTRSYDRYLEVLAASKTTICGPAVSPMNLGQINGLPVFAPQVYPGRIAEALASVTIPLYMQPDGYSLVELPSVDEMIPIFPISVADADERLDHALSLLNDRSHYERISVLCSDYHRKYLSPEALFTPFVDKFIAR